MANDLPERLRANCNGKPATIPWPHRILHEAADYIDRIDGTLAMRLEIEDLAAKRCELREREKTAEGRELNDIHCQIAAITDAIANITLHM